MPLRTRAVVVPGFRHVVTRIQYREEALDSKLTKTRKTILSAITRSWRRWANRELRNHNAVVVCFNHEICTLGRVASCGVVRAVAIMCCWGGCVRTKPFVRKVRSRGWEMQVRSLTCTVRASRALRSRATHRLRPAKWLPDVQ